MDWQWVRFWKGCDVMTRHEQAVIDTALAVARAKEARILAAGRDEASTFEMAARRRLAFANADFHLAESEMNHAYAVRDLIEERGGR